MEAVNELALFAGIGGGILGGRLSGFTTVCAVEREPYCREVLLRRQRDGMLPMFPIWDSAETFTGEPWSGVVDIVTAGFPCQPFSVAGKQRGRDDERNLWPETIRIIREVGPRYVLLENVPGLVRTDYFGTILGDLAEAGFDARWDVVSAVAVGAPHRRERLWIMANANSQRSQGREVLPERANQRASGESCMGDTDNPRQLQQERTLEEIRGWISHPSWWLTEPDVGRVADGTPFRVDRLRALGNAQVPEVARTAWDYLLTNNDDYVIVLP